MATSGTVSQQRYQRLVAFARVRPAQDGYFERHHVVPRSEGGDDSAGNLVQLTAREHFLAHWLLYRIYRSSAAARAFRLMVNSQGRRRGRDYAAARETMAAGMRGELNVARRAEVREKLRANYYSPFAGKKRPEHAALMRARGFMAGDKNPGFGAGERQRGDANHMAKAIKGQHATAGERRWGTLTDAASHLGVTVQAVSQALRRGGRTRGWSMEHV